MEMEKARGIEEESNPILRLGNKLEFQRHFLQNWARSLRCRDGYGEGNRQTFHEILEVAGTDMEMETADTFRKFLGCRDGNGDLETGK